MSWLSKAWKKVKNTVKKVVRVVKEVFNRAVGLLGFIGDLLGLGGRKYMRLRVMILCKEGKPVADIAKVQPMVDMARTTFDEEANVKLQGVQPFGDAFIHVLTNDAPPEALRAPAPPPEDWWAGFSDGADYFEDQIRSAGSGGPAGTGGGFAELVFGYGEPLFVFIVEEVIGDRGAAYFWGSTYVVVAASALLTDTAHELGHACGLTHGGSLANLMNRARDGDAANNLSRWQSAWARNSRFVVYSANRT